MIFERHANLKYGNRNFWAKGYFVSTVGLNDEVVKEYIRNQEKQEMMEDNLSNKEYVDLFKKAQKLSTFYRGTNSVNVWLSVIHMPLEGLVK